jgi:hypothetical protein
MPVRRPPYSIPAVHAQRTANHLRELADRAERGELIGAAVTVWTASKDPECSVSGLFEKSHSLAHWCACRLRDTLLYPSE